MPCAVGWLTLQHHGVILQCCCHSWSSHHCCLHVRCFCSALLARAGITINQLQSCGSKGEQIPGGSLLPAVLCVLGSVTVPSAASVYNEKGLKQHMDTSVHLQNFFLYFYGMCFNLLGALTVCLYKRQSFMSIFDHQTKVTLILVVNNALQVCVSGGVQRCLWVVAGDAVGRIKYWQCSASAVTSAVVCPMWVPLHVSQSACDLDWSVAGAAGLIAAWLFTEHTVARQTGALTQLQHQQSCQG